MKNQTDGATVVLVFRIASLNFQGTGLGSLKLRVTKLSKNGNAYDEFGRK